jgi:hypothetical protein
MIRIFIQVGSQNFHPKSVCCTLQLSMLWYEHHNLQMAFIWKSATFMHNMWVLKRNQVYWWLGYYFDRGIGKTLKNSFDIDSMCGAK